MANTALITGSYGGLGSCFVSIHAKRGGDLILVGRSEEKLQAQSQQVSADYGVNVQTIAVCGLPGWQRPMMACAPLMPKKTMLDFVYSQQLPGSAGK